MSFAAIRYSRSLRATGPAPLLAPDSLHQSGHNSKGQLPGHLWV